MITITIDTDNAAFDGNLEGELTRILWNLGDKVLDDNLHDNMPLRDSNGNAVGKVVIT